MCEECGCGELYDELEKPVETHEHHHDHHGHHDHDHGHDHHHAHHDHSYHHEHSPSDTHTKTLDIGLSALKKNDDYAMRNRQFFKERNVLAINLISSPGSGKTTLLEQMARLLGKSMAVIVGDIQTRRDAQRIVACGSPAYQIETNGACHLDAHGVSHALEKLDFTEVKICIIENVGNLVCPAAYDLGETFKVAILSAPEGDDKVLKYPSIFSRASIVLINKMDIAGYLDFDVEKVKKECKSLNDQCDIFSIAAKTGQGVEDFCQFLKIKKAQQKG
jgi:hydrogenase nickel incorporation protein HypB